MARVAATTMAADKSLDSLSKRSVESSRVNKTLSADLDRTSVSAKKVDASINQLTGRLRVFADVAAMIGPALSPIGAVGAAGIGGIANQMGVAVLAAGSALAAFQGVGSALEAVNKAALEPTAENLAAANAEMAKLSPAAAAAVASLRDLRPTLLGIRDAGAEGLMPGFTSMLDSLEARGPEIANIVGTLNATLGGLLASGGKALEGAGWSQFFDFLAADSASTLASLGTTVGNLTRGFSEMWMAFDPLNDGFSDWLLEVSEGFASWGDGLSESAGFREFVAYVQSTGPQVASSLSAIGGAFLDVMVAAAPVGGPVLSALEAVAKVISAIAESDLGMPIIAGTAALAAFNRVAAVTTGLSARMGGAGIMGLVTGSTAGGTARSAKSVVGGIRSDLAAMSDGMVAFGANTEKSAAAAGRMRDRLSGVAKGGAALGGLALLSTGAADGLGATNTASLALMGTMAGPWGAAVGAGVGALMDMRKTAGDAFDALDQLGSALGRISGEVTALDFQALNDGFTIAEEKVAKLQEMRENPFSSGVGGFFGSIKNDVEDTFGSSDVEEAEEALEGYREQLSRVQVQVADTAAIEAQNAAIAQSAQGAMDAASQWGGLGDSLDDAKVSLGDWLSELEKQNQAMADFRENAIKAGKKGVSEGLIDKLREMGPEGALRMQQLADGTVDAAKRASAAHRRQAREIDALAAAGANLPPEIVTRIATRGVPKTMAEVERLVEKYNLTDDERQALITVSGVDRAVSELNRADAAADAAARDRTANIIFHYMTTGTKPSEVKPGPYSTGYVMPGQRKADGGTIEGQRYPYGDKVLAYLAPGEEVITNRHGEADRFRRDRAAGVIPAYANGGSVGRPDFAHSALSPLAFRGGQVRVDGDWVKFAKGLRIINRELDKTERGLGKARDTLEGWRDKMRATGEKSTSHFAPDLFEQPSNPWAAGSGGPRGALKEAIAGLRDRQTLQSRLSKAGLKGDAFDAAMEGDNADLRAMLAGGKGGVRGFQRDWNTYSKLQDSTASQAGRYAYGKNRDRAVEDVRDMKKELADVKSTLRRTERAQKKWQDRNDDIGGKVAKGVNRSASNAKRNRRNG